MEFKKLALVDPKLLPSPSPPSLHSENQSQLSSLDTDMKRILYSNLSDSEKVTLYNQILTRYRDVYAKSKEPLTIQIKDNYKQVQTLPMREEILHFIPKSLKNKASDLLQRLSNRNDINWNDKGELIVDNETIHGSHIVDLVGDLIRSRKQDPPRGWRAFADALSRLNLPAELIGNSERWQYIHGTPTNVKTKRDIKPKVKWETDD